MHNLTVAPPVYACNPLTYASRTLQQQNTTIFTMTRFHTNRTLENVFFDRDEEVKHRVRFFEKNRAWYVIKMCARAHYSYARL